MIESEMNAKISSCVGEEEQQSPERIERAGNIEAVICLKNDIITRTSCSTFIITYQVFMVLRRDSMT
jgi:hypothetical protein